MGTGEAGHGHIADSKNGTDLELPLRRMVHRLEWLAGMKSLIIFVVFYALYISLCVVRLDWMEGHQTIAWLDDAHTLTGTVSPDQMSSLEEISAYIERKDGLGKVISQLHETCVGCEVGITPLPRDMGLLELDDFVCSDFDSKAGSDVYPSRDCKMEDAKWASHPDSNSAPCCKNATLVTASIGMMTEQLKNGLTELPLKTLLGGGSDGTFGATEYFLHHFIKEKGFLLQFVISRQQRMAAVAYHVPHYDDEAPTRVKPTATFWSFNYASKSVTSIIAGLLIVSGLYVVAHSMREFWDLLRQEQARTRMDSEMARAPAAAAPVISWNMCETLKRTFITAIHRGVFRCSKYSVIIEIPSVFGPLLLEILRPHMLLSQWTFLVSIAEMVMTIRLLQEGRVIPALRLVIRTIESALKDIIALLIVLVPTTILTAVMHSQIFGLFDEGFADPWVALTRVVRMLTAPPPKETIEGVDGQSAPVGAEVMYYWGTIVIRLCFGSFVVAILVSAFNKVSSALNQEESTRERRMELPNQYSQSLSFQRSWKVAIDAIGYVTAFPAFTTLHGTPVPRLIKEFKDKIDSVELEDEESKEKEIFVTADELEEIVGSETTELLLDRYGVVRLKGGEAMAA